MEEEREERREKKRKEVSPAPTPTLSCSLHHSTLIRNVIYLSPAIYSSPPNDGDIPSFQ